MRKVLSVIALLALLMSGAVAPANASSKKTTIQTVSESRYGQAWEVMDNMFYHVPRFQREFMKQGRKMTVVGLSKKPVNTYPLKSLPASKGGHWVYTASPVKRGHIKLTKSQHKKLKKILPVCNRKVKVNCYKGNTVKFPQIKAVRK